MTTSADMIGDEQADAAAEAASLFVQGFFRIDVVVLETHWQHTHNDYNYHNTYSLH